MHPGAMAAIDVEPSEPAAARLKSFLAIGV